MASLIYNPDIHHRCSIRLKDYDYSQAGAYFVTLCTKDRECLMGEIVDGQMQLNHYGQIAANCWEWLPRQYEYIDMDEWIIMPNHLHGILVINDDGRKGGSRTAPTQATKRKSLGRLIGAFKTVSSKQINTIRKTPGAVIWQRNYFERVIRNKDELRKIRDYIIGNPLTWEQDENYNATS
jgi:putative transposase